MTCWHKIKKCEVKPHSMWFRKQIGPADTIFFLRWTCWIDCKCAFHWNVVSDLLFDFKNTIISSVWLIEYIGELCNCECLICREWIIQFGVMEPNAWLHSRKLRTALKSIFSFTSLLPITEENSSVPYLWSAQNAFLKTGFVRTAWDFESL